MTAAPGHRPVRVDQRAVETIVGAVRDTPPVVTVVGDVILDRWSIGEAERVSREAPAPVVRLTETIDVPGGAANTAMNLRALGARVRMVGIVGDDAAGRSVRGRLDAAGIDVGGLVVAEGAVTTTKARIVGGDRIVVRLDEIAPPSSPAGDAALADAVAAALTDTDAVVLCDYGITTPPSVVVPVVLAARPRVVVVDAHDLRLWRDVRPDLVTPNAGEAERLLGRSLGQGTDRTAAACAAADELVDVTGARAVIVTLDRDVTVGFGPGEEPFRTRATPASEQQASGAGDTFCAAVSVALAVGTPLGAAAAFAQAAADVVVREPGTSVCTSAAVVASVTAPVERIVDHDDLAELVADARAVGRRVVFTNGCFDVVHRGHTSYLRQARALGDLLVVAVNDDDSVRRLKGPDRPINPAEDRAGVLAALASVDLVTVFSTDTPIPLLERLRPDVYVKGGDYSPEMLDEADVVRGYGGDVVMVDYVAEHSTTDVVRRIRSSEGRDTGRSTTER